MNPESPYHDKLWVNCQKSKTRKEFLKQQEKSGSSCTRVTHKAVSEFLSRNCLSQKKMEWYIQRTKRNTQLSTKDTIPCKTVLQKQKRNKDFPRLTKVSLVAQMVKNLPAMQETQVLSGLRRKWQPTPVFLENSIDRTWQATVHGVTKNQTWLSD